MLEGSIKQNEISEQEAFQDYGVVYSKPEDLKKLGKYSYESYKEGEDKDAKPKYIPKRKEKKDVVIFVVEDTSMVNDNKNTILKLISKIIDGNKEDLFLFISLSDINSYFELMDYKMFTDEHIIDTIILDSCKEVSKQAYLDAVKYIEKFLVSQHFDFKYRDKEYEVQNNNIIFIGTGEFNCDETTKEELLTLIKKVKTKSKVKAIKYFCIKDNQVVNTAAMGFPVIGHIVTDFYA